VRVSVDAGYLFKGFRLLHLIPAVIHLSLLVPLLFAEPDLRAAIEADYLAREIFRSFIPGIRIAFLVTFCYALVSLFWIHRYKRHVVDVASFGDEQNVRWLRLFVLLVLSLLFLLGLFSQRSSYPLLPACTMTAFMSIVMLTALTRPHLFHGIPAILKLSGEPKEEEKYGASQLDEEQKSAYLDALRSHFEGEKPYLKQDLTLREVSQQTGIPYRYVSQVVNEKLKLHFMDFVNGYRIEAAKRMLVDPEWTHLSISGIAAEAGFKSRSAFYAAFRKATGSTPGDFKKAHLSA
jgi:AraC-like DNA-binding protein